jgi:CheY-like chemotaxis protein
MMTTAQNASAESDDTKLLYDMMLRRTHETARALEERVEEVNRRFPDTAMSQEGATAGRRMLVLIVEDNPDQAESLSMVLQLWGFETEIAYDGSTAYEMATRDHPDAILTDIGLPGEMDGFELTERLAARPDLQGTLMAAVTAYNDEDSRQRSKQVGFDKHFSKPADLAELHRFLDDRRDMLLRRAASPGCN